MRFAKFAASQHYTYVGNDPMDRTDPSGLKPGDPFDSSEAAADDALNFINPTSITENREYGGNIQRREGVYYASEPKPGSGDRVPISVPKGNGVGDYHTHGDYSKKGPKGEPIRTTKDKDEFDSDNFSGPDKSNSRIVRDKVDSGPYKSYLGTPSGKNKVYDPNDRKSRDLVVPPVRQPPKKQCGHRECPDGI